MADCCTWLVMSLVVLPVLGVIKATIYTPIISLVTAVSVIGTTLLLLPYHIYKACAFLVVGKSVDINIKILLSLALLVAIPLWPVIVITACCLMPLIVFVITVCDTFFYYYISEDKCANILNSFAAEQCKQLIVEFWKYSYNKLPAVIDEMCDTYYEGQQYKLRLVQLLIDIPVILMSLLIDIVPVTVICILRYVPLNLYPLFCMWTNVVQTWLLIILFVPCLIVTVVLPVLTAVAIPLVVIASSFYNLKAVIIMYQTASVVQGLQTCFKLYANTLCYIDSGAAAWSGCSRAGSCFKHFNYGQQLQRHQTVVEQRVTSSIPIVRVWDSLFAVMRELMLEAMRSNLCSHDDIEAIEPYLVQGLPNLVFCRTLKRSEGSAGIVLADGAIIDASTAPNSYLTTLLLPKFMVVKNKFDALKLNDIEYTAVENWLLLGGRNDSSDGATTDYGTNSSVIKAVSLDQIFTNADRHKAVMEVVANIHSFTGLIAPIPIFRERFGETCKLVLLETSA